MCLRDLKNFVHIMTKDSVPVHGSLKENTIISEWKYSPFNTKYKKYDK